MPKINDFSLIFVVKLSRDVVRRLRIQTATNGAIISWVKIYLNALPSEHYHVAELLRIRGMRLVPRPETSKMGGGCRETLRRNLPAEHQAKYFFASGL